MHKILAYLFICFSFSLFAQPGVSNIVERNGKKYYEHKVDDGNTLWGMQQMYGVPYQEIIDANPGFDGLKKGEVVYVPVSGEVEAAQDEPTSSYKVKKGETLYGLSRKFNTTVDRLIELNPELADGLKKGQVIQVPGTGETAEQVNDPVEVVTTPNPFVIDTVETEGSIQEVVVSFSDSTINHVVLAHETMYSISKRFMVSISDIMEINGLQSTSVKEGQVLVIPVKNERVDKVEIRSVPGDYDPDSKEPLVFPMKDEYKVALLLPLFLEYGEGYSESISNLSAQFYMGATMALDSLERKGLNAKVYVFDTKNDTNTINTVLAKPEFQDMDMIVGPLLGKNMAPVARFAKANKVRMVCPVSSNAELLENNRLVYAALPSNISLMRGLARYILDNCQGDHVLLVKPLDEKSLPLYEAFREAFNAGEVNGTRPTLVETTVGNFNAYIKRGKENHFVVPTSHRSTAVKFMNQLNKSAFRAYKDDIFVYGTKDWVDLAELNDVYKNKYNLHFAGPNHVDYYTEEMTEMNKVYRAKFKTDMSKIAVQAYDVLTYFCSDFFLGNKNSFLLMNNIELEQVSEMDGYENRHVYIIRQQDFELIDVLNGTRE